MSRSSGTGSPLNFRCWYCRRQETCQDFKSDRGWGNRVVRTGFSKMTGRGSPRHNDLALQYRCLDCGHVGYSKHKDLARKVEKADA